MTLVREDGIDLDAGRLVTMYTSIPTMTTMQDIETEFYRETIADPPESLARAAAKSMSVSAGTSQDTLVRAVGERDEMRLHGPRQRRPTSCWPRGPAALGFAAGFGEAHGVHKGVGIVAPLLIRQRPFFGAVAQRAMPDIGRVCARSPRAA